MGLVRRAPIAPLAATGSVTPVEPRMPTPRGLVAGYAAPGALATRSPLVPRQRN